MLDSEHTPGYFVSEPSGSNDNRNFNDRNLTLQVDETKVFTRRALRTLVPAYRDHSEYRAVKVFFRFNC
jgi:hypothetical protein